MKLTVTNRAILAGVMLAAPAWLQSRRRTYRPGAVPLRDHERAGLEPFFTRSTLDAVRIARVERFRPWPMERSLGRLGFRGLLASQTIAGIALIDTIVLVTSAMHDRQIRPMSLLFHEMVHIEQYAVLGARGFLREYVGGWLGADRSYLDIPLEVQAYELCDRYDADPSRPFAVIDEVRTLMARHSAHA